MSSWRKAGISFNKYLQIAAQTVRNSVKPEFQNGALAARGKSEAKVFKFENGVAKEPVPLK